MSSASIIEKMETVILKEKKIFLINNFLTSSESETFIEMMNEKNTETIGVHANSYRFCERSVIKMEDLAKKLWERIKLIMEEQKVMDVSIEAQHKFSGHWDAIGLNETFRLVRYKKGGHFDAHCDSYFERNDAERSFWTLNIYLNTVYSKCGGATRFLDSDISNPEVQPKMGSALLFFQPNILHEGVELIDGKKYLMRSDVMFRRREGSAVLLSNVQEEALELYRRAEELEISQDQDRAWRLYAKSFKLWPELETHSQREGDFT